VCAQVIQPTDNDLVNGTPSQSIIRPETQTELKGATENAGLENAGPSKMQGWKTRDWKTRDHNTGGGKRETISYGTPN